MTGFLARPRPGKGHNPGRARPVTGFLATVWVWTIMVAYAQGRWAEAQSRSAKGPGG